MARRAGRDPEREKMKFLIYLLLYLIILSTKVEASPIYLTLDSGFTFFKWGPTQTDLGFPNFESPKWDIEPGIEWTPKFLEKNGVWLRVSFPWQALGQSATFFHKGQTYIDGPRIGIRFRGRIIQ